MTAEETEISVTESDEDITVQVCVELTEVKSGLEREVIVNLNTVIGTASKYQQLKRYI